MEELKRIEIIVESENELKGQYGDWDIIGIDLESSSARHSYSRFRNKDGKLMVRCSHESATGRNYESNVYEWKDGYLGTLNTMSEIKFYYCDNWVKRIVLRKGDTIIHATVTDGKIFR